MNLTIRTDLEEKAFELKEDDCNKLMHIAASMQREYRNSRDDRPFEDGYKGFLIVKCKACGKIKGFCAKTPMTTFRCSCGEETPLSHMRKAYVTCKCGGHFRYRTNITDEYFDFSCLSCGSPVDMFWNAKKRTFESM